MKAYKERKSVDIDWNEVLGFFFAILLVVALVAVCAGFIYEIHKQSEEDRIRYNNGIHQDCGGRWVIKGSGDGYILYECEKCKGSFTATHNFSSIEE